MDLDLSVHFMDLDMCVRGVDLAGIHSSVLGGWELPPKYGDD